MAAGLIDHLWTVEELLTNFAITQTQQHLRRTILTIAFYYDFVLQGACQWRALAAGGGFGGEKPKGELAFGAESLGAGAALPARPLHAMLGAFYYGETR